MREGARISDLMMAHGGDFHDVALVGDRLADGSYKSIAVEMLEDGHLRGYSEALGLYVCWEDGKLSPHSRGRNGSRC